jgi:hypothetical protein
MLNFRRPSPALVIAVIAVFIAATGGAWAASGAPSNGPTAAGAAKKHVKINRGPRGFRGRRGFRGAAGVAGPAGARGLTGPAGATGATGAIGPSNGFVKSQPAATGLTAGADTTVVQLSLTPGSNYIVTAATELGNTSGVSNLVSCTLLENSNPIGGGSAFLPALNVFAQTVTLTAATTGGNIKLSCNPTTAAQARNSVITAIRVGALQTQ